MTSPLPGATSCPEWIHPDAGEYGYYRWSVPREVAARLGEAVSSPWGVGGTAGSDDATRSRIALLDQSWAMVAAGKLDPGVFLSTLEAVAKHGGRRELEQVASRLDRVAEVWDELARGEGFESFVRRTLEPEGKRLSWDPAPGEADDDAILRPRLLEALGIRGRAPWVLAGAADRTRKYLDDPASIPASIAATALAIAARHGELGFADARRLLASARTPGARTNALTAMENLPPGPPLASALELALTDAVRVQDLNGILNGALERAETRDQAFAFLEARFDDIVNRMPGGFAGAPRLERRIGVFCSEARRDAARAFFEGKKIPGGERFLTEGVQNASQCIALRSYGQASLKSFFDAARPSAE